MGERIEGVRRRNGTIGVRRGNGTDRSEEEKWDR
jgi:hypothetical protein